MGGGDKDTVGVTSTGTHVLLWDRRERKRECVYLEGERVDEMAQLLGLGVEGGRPVKEPAAAEHHPAGLQLLVPRVHKTPVGTRTHMHAHTRTHAHTHTHTHTHAHTHAHTEQMMH